jgi:hypothetical protein
MISLALRCTQLAGLVFMQCLNFKLHVDPVPERKGEQRWFAIFTENHTLPHTHVTLKESGGPSRNQGRDPVSRLFLKKINQGLT